MDTTSPLRGSKSPIFFPRLPRVATSRAGGLGMYRIVSPQDKEGAASCREGWDWRRARTSESRREGEMGRLISWEPQTRQSSFLVWAVV